MYTIATIIEKILLQVLRKKTYFSHITHTFSQLWKEAKNVARILSPYFERDKLKTKQENKQQINL